jgi:hypothetical protein
MRHRRGDGIDFQGPDMSLSSKPSDTVVPLRFEGLADATRYLDEQGVRYVLAQFVDIHGVARAKAVPAAHLASVLGDGAGFAGFAIRGVGIEPHGPDFMAVGELGTLPLAGTSWIPGVGSALSAAFSGALRRPVSTSMPMRRRG